MYQKGGYNSDEAIALDLMPVIGKSQKQIMQKISKGFTRNEELVIASHFEFSPKEFYETFMHGLFQVNREGHLVAHVDNPKVLLMPPLRGKSKRKTSQEDILARLEELEDEYGL